MLHTSAPRSRKSSSPARSSLSGFGSDRTRSGRSTASSSCSGRRSTGSTPERESPTPARASSRFDAIVLATGSRARTLSGARTLRTLDDALELRRELRPGRRLAVVGGGFVGAEVASTARTLGVEVSLVEAASTPFAQTLGPEVGELLASRWRAYGVDVRTGLATFPTPTSSWLGSEPSPPASCSAAALCRPTAAGERRSRTSTRAATWRASTAAASSTGPTPRARRRRSREQCSAGSNRHDALPYFWSDQFGLRLQYVGFGAGWATLRLDGGEDAFTARYFDRSGRLLAGLAANEPTSLALLRGELAETALPSAA